MIRKLFKVGAILLLLAGTTPKLLSYLFAISAYSEAEERIAHAVQTGRTVLDLDDLRYLREIPESIHEIQGLWYLNASTKRLIDIQSLSGLPDLKNLYLVETRVTDLTPLTQLRSLEELDIGKSWVADLEPLSRVPRLRWIQMNEIAVKSLCPLNQMTSLNWLNLYKSYAEDGSQDCYNDIKSRIPQLGDGTPYEQNYTPGKMYKSKISFRRWLQQIEWL